MTVALPKKAGASEMEEGAEWKSLDASEMSYEEWLRFLFDRPIYDDSVAWEAYSGEYDDIDVSQPGRIVEYLTRMCREFKDIAAAYSRQQVDQALWALFGQFKFHSYVHDRSVPLDDRIQCIRAMYFVFADVVAKRSGDVTQDFRSYYNSEDFYWMWWRYVAKELWNSHEWERLSSSDTVEELARMLTDARPRWTDEWAVESLDDDYRSILEAVMDTLVAILRINHKGCQLCALHGLGRLHHPEVARVVQEYIDHSRDALTLEELQWLEQCRDGVPTV